MILAEKLILLRKKNGWSQEELAEKVKVSRQSVSKWESASSVPDLDKVLLLAGVFGVSTDYLLKDELGEQEYPNEALETPLPDVRRVSLSEAKDYLATRAVASKRIALATFLCILSPVPLLLLGAASEYPAYGVSENLAGGLGVIGLLVIVAAAVAIFISTGMKSERFAYLDKEAIETEYGVSGMVNERLKESNEAYTRDCVIGACTCILAVVPLLAAAFLTENDFFLMIALSITLLLAGIGVVFFIKSGVIRASMQKLLQEGEYTKERKGKNKTLDAINSVYWLLVVAGYLAYSFLTNDWARSWIVWPVAGVLSAVVNTVGGLILKQE